MRNTVNKRKMVSNCELEQPETMFLGHITLSRQSTIGCSSRIYYRNPEGIPFKWEEEPGKAIEPQPNQALPPLSPPPAILSLGFPKPSIELDQDSENEPTKLSPAWLWKRIKSKVKKGKDMNKAIVKVFRRAKGSTSDRDQNLVETEGSCRGDVGCDESYLWKFDGEMMRLAPRSTSVSSSLSSSNSLSSSSSSLTNNAPSLEASKYHHPSFTCSPRNLGEIMISLVKRARSTDNQAI